MTAKRSSVRRTVADHVVVALVLCYLGVLIVGGWPKEVRPRLLDRPQYWAQVLLWATGIRPGLEVFHERTGEDYKFRAHCIKVEARGQDQPAVPLFPTSGKCFTRGVRLRVPPMEVVLYRMMRHAWELWRGANGIVDYAAADRTFARIGDYYCGQPNVQSLATPRIYVVWYSYVESYSRPGDELRGGFVYFGWDCPTGDFFAKQWRLDPEPLPHFDQAVLQFWKSPPWALD